MTAYSTRDWDSTQYRIICPPCCRSMEGKSASYGSYGSAHAPPLFSSCDIDGLEGPKEDREVGAGAELFYFSHDTICHVVRKPLQKA